MMRRRSAIRGLFGAAALGLGIAHAADVAAPNIPPIKGVTCSPEKVKDGDFDSPSVATTFGDPFAVARQHLRDCGIRYHAIYTGDLFDTVSGGFAQGPTYGGRLDLGLEADLEKLVGWTGATFHINGFLIHGRSQTADKVGSLFPITNAEAPPQARLFEVWLEQKIGSYGSLRIGQLAADSEFTTSEHAGAFINGTFGWPGISATALPSGGPAYPFATPGARLELDFSPQTKLRLGVFNGDPASPHGLSVHTDDGVFLIAELQQGYSVGAGQAALPGTLKIGAWYHSGDFPTDTCGCGPAALHGDGAAYAIVDQTFVKLPGEGDRSIGGFARIAGAPDDRNLLTFYADAGVTVKGPFASRPDDTFGVAFAYGRISDRARDADRLTALRIPGYPIRDYEALIEVSYQYKIVDGWTVQPDFQYIFHPGGHVPNPFDPSQTMPVKNAAVIGVRTTIQY